MREPEASGNRVGIEGVAVKEAARLLGKPPSTLYGWINRGWVETVASETERGKPVMLIPVFEIERLKAFSPVENESEPSGNRVRGDSIPTGEPMGIESESDAYVPAPPFPTRDDILSLIREQLAAERVEKEQLRRENQEACRRIGALEQALREAVPALEAGHAATRGEISALAARVGEIDSRSREQARRGRITALASLLLALLCAVMGEMLLTSRASLPPTALARGSAKGFEPARLRAEPKPPPATRGRGGISTTQPERTKAEGPR
jgi:hypothetical protein